MKKSLLNECLRLARAKLSNHPELLNYPHFSFLILNNQICSVGMNRQHEPEKSFGYHRRVLKSDFRPKYHSELDAIRKSWRGLNGGFQMVNVRLSKGQETRMSCPCSVCHLLLTSLGCTKCYFTTNEGWGRC